MQIGNKSGRYYNKEKYCMKLKYISLIMTNIITICALVGSTYGDDFGKLDCNDLSESFKSVISHCEKHHEWLFDGPWLIVKIDNKNIKYFDTHNLKFLRTNSMLNALNKIMSNSAYKLANGEYLIYLGDKVIQEFPWPVLSFATTPDFVKKDAIILIPDTDALDGYQNIFKDLELGFKQFPWNKKKDIIFWRGRATGTQCLSSEPGATSREKFLNYSKGLSYVDAGFTSYGEWWPENSIKYLTQNYPLKEFVSPSQSLEYKLLIDINGDTCTFQRMAWILYSKSLLLKHHSDEIQWYYNLLRANVHYLPINKDFSNLEEQFVWAKTHDQEAITIANNAHELAKQVFAPEAIMQATVHGFNRYNQVVKRYKYNFTFNPAEIDRMLTNISKTYDQKSIDTFLRLGGLNKGERPKIHER